MLRLQFVMEHIKEHIILAIFLADYRHGPFIINRPNKTSRTPYFFHSYAKRCLRARRGWYYILYYNIAFVNSERWFAKIRVDITQCQHGNVGNFLSSYFFVLYYKTNIKLFSVSNKTNIKLFSIKRYKTNIKLFYKTNIKLFSVSWKLGKLEIVWKHSSLRASCFHTISRSPNFHSCWYNCISIFVYLYIIYTVYLLNIPCHADLPWPWDIIISHVALRTIYHWT
jgi:hypothetical protein